MKIGETIYLDYQAATPIDPRVRQAMIDADSGLFANPHASDHILGWRAGAAIQAAATDIADYFGMSEHDLIFTSGASEANTMAILAAKTYASASGPTEIIICEGDHSSILNEAHRSELTVKTCPLRQDGSPSIEWLAQQVTKNTAMVTVIAVNNENGAIADLVRAAEICQENNALLHADLAQAPCAQDLDLAEIGISMATLSAHKVYGPKGIGAFLIAPEARQWVKPIILGGGQQNGIRGGTLPTDLCIGFATAINILKSESASERAKVAKLRNSFVTAIEDSRLGLLIGSRDNRHPGNALIHFPGHDAADLLSRLQPYIAASSQSACSSGTIDPSRVIQAMGYDRTAASECIRFSFGRFSDKEQVQEAMTYLKQALAKQ